MKKVIIPAVIVLMAAVAALSLGTFTGDGQTALIGDTSKECTKNAVMASGKECGEKSRSVMASEKRECGDKPRAAMASKDKDCVTGTGATRASETLECPYSGKVLKADSEKKSCGEKPAAARASADNTGDDEACCADHAMAAAD